MRDTISNIFCAYGYFNKSLNHSFPKLSFRIILCTSLQGLTRTPSATVLIFFDGAGGVGADGSQTARTLSPGDEDEEIMRASREVRGVMNLFLCSLRDSGVCRASSPRQFISAENKPLSCGDRDQTQTTTKTRQNKRPGRTALRNWANQDIHYRKPSSGNLKNTQFWRDSMIFWVSALLLLENSRSLSLAAFIYRIISLIKQSKMQETLDNIISDLQPNEGKQSMSH